MRRRQGTALAAAVLCLGGALTACGGGDGNGYAAVGAAGPGPEAAPTAGVPPQGEVVLTPLDGEKPSVGPAPSDGPSAAPSAGGTAAGEAAPGTPQRPGAGGAGGVGGGSGGSSGGSGAGPGSSGTGAPAPGPSGGAPTTPGTPPAEPGPEPPPGPAVLTLGEPVRTALDKRWCEKVTVEIRNTGGSPATSGTVTFATHIIGALGIDWATIRSDQPLPAPITVGSVRKHAYTVCVDAWRVPLGMRIETQDVTVTWK